MHVLYLRWLRVDPLFLVHRRVEFECQIAAELHPVWLVWPQQQQQPVILVPSEMNG